MKKFETAESWNKIACILLTSNEMISLCNLKWISSHKCFTDYKLHLPRGLVQWLLILTVFTWASFQIALGIIWLLIQTVC